MQSKNAFQPKKKWILPVAAIAVGAAAAGTYAFMRHRKKAADGAPTGHGPDDRFAA